MTYLTNCWYCVGWSDAVPAGTITPITVIEREIVMFRDEAGRAAALENRCPHRFAPLDTGRVCDGRLQCGYHGLLFDRNGRCVGNPHAEGFIPPRARVRAYPLVERFGALWLWPGDAEPDEALLPDFRAFDPEAAFVGRRYLHVRANYQLDVDNILDLSHIQYLHGDTLGSDAVATARTWVTQTGTTVASHRLVTGERLTPFLEKAFFVPPGQPVDRRLDVHWSPPACMQLEVAIVPTGRPEAEGHLRTIAHIFTPETATTSHYYFALAHPRSMGPHAEALATDGIAGLAIPFEREDLPMLEAQQRIVGTNDFMSMHPAILEGDAGATRARRVLARLIADENRVFALAAKELA